VQKLRRSRKKERPTSSRRSLNEAYGPPGGLFGIDQEVVTKIPC
jgi:hypothetical protein